MKIKISRLAAVAVSGLLAGTVAACGGFSYGDVLGAGEGWAKSILFHEAVREEFRTFFERPDTFSVGICNGCQMFAALRELIPGTEHWPRFVTNLSEQYESRFVLVEGLHRLEAAKALGEKTIVGFRVDARKH